MSKIDYKQAIEVTHQNVAQIMSLPCVERCSKDYYQKKGDVTYFYYVSDLDCNAWEGDWIVELGPGEWMVYGKKEWEELR